MHVEIFNGKMPLMQRKKEPQAMSRLPGRWSVSGAGECAI